MRRRLFWFAVGVGVTAVLVVKGREYYQRLTPKGVIDQAEKTVGRARNWVDDFFDTMGSAMDERETELREALGLDGEHFPVQESPRT